MASDPFYSNIFKKEKRVLEYREIIKKKVGEKVKITVCWG